MCLLSECRRVLWVNVVNIGAVLQEWWLILWDEFINFKLDFFSSAHELRLNYFQSMYLCNHDTLQASSFVDLAFRPSSRNVLRSVWHEGGWWWCSSSPWRLRETPQEIRGGMQQLNNSTSVWKKNICPYISEYQKYLFYCSISRLDWSVVSKADDKIIKIIAHIHIVWAAGFSPHRYTVRATAYRLARELGILNDFSDETETAGYDRWKNVFS